MVDRFSTRHNKIGVVRHIFFFFTIRVFFHGHWRLTGQQEKGGDLLLFHSTTSTRSRTFGHLFATLHVRWLSCIFNRNACLPDCYSMRFTTLSNYHLIDWWWETGGFELASTITLVLQANRLTKCASHPIFVVLYWLCCLTGKASAKITGLKLLRNLNNSTASVARFLWYIETDPSFYKRSSKDYFCHYKLNEDIFHGDNLSYCY